MNKNYSDFLKSDVYKQLCEKYLTKVKEAKSKNEIALAYIFMAQFDYTNELLKAYHEWLINENV